MFFALSKLLWFLASPANLLLIALVGGAVLLWTPWRRAGRRLLGLAALIAVTVSVLPLGHWLIFPLEDRFSALTALPPRVDGIIILGGVVNQRITRSRGQVAVGGAVERLTELARLARLYPDAKLVFTGGSGDLFNQDLKEANVIAPFLETIGLDPSRVLTENQSRNTHENAVLTRALISPRDGETWIVITSAAHMPRAVGCFRQAGWPGLIPYPVDYGFEAGATGRPPFDLGSGLAALGGGLHEWLGLLFYWLTDRTDTLFPGPERGP